MRIVFLLERPSQFDAPLFRRATQDRDHDFEAWFTAADAAGTVRDRELGRRVDWGFDRLAGYRSRILPARERWRWVGERLAAAPADLLIVNGYTRLTYLVAARAARSAGVPTALRIDSVRFPGEPEAGWARQARFVLLGERYFDLFLTTGTLGERYLEGCGVDPERVGRFPYAVDHEAFRRDAEGARAARAEVRARLGVPAGARVVLSLAKFSEREAPWTLLEAAERSGDPGLWWVLAGDGPERGDAARRVAERALDRVVLPGYLPYPELPAVYAAADLFVHPAREERWGVSVAETLACGLPVVASERVGAAWDLIVPGVNGERLPTGDAAALAAAIARALELDPARVTAASAPRLAAFGLEATWRGLVAAAGRAREAVPA